MSDKAEPKLTPGIAGVEGPQEKVELSILQRIESMARLHGERFALAAPCQEPLTYKRLIAQVKNVVGALNDVGISRGDRVALVPAGGPNSAVATLALASGAICAPLNPVSKEQEVKTFFIGLRPNALVVEPGTASAAAAIARKQSIPVIELDTRGSVRVTSGRCQIAPTTSTDFAGIDETALILFTSGTTAGPKLVPLTHANLLTSGSNIAATLELTPDDRCLNIMPLFHIHGLVGGLLATLVSGGSVVCPVDFRAAKFPDWLEQSRATWYTAVPTMHKAILAHARDYAGSAGKHSLRFIRSASAPLPTSVMADLEDVFRAPVIEAYGMTEAAHQIASNPLPPLPRKPGSVGRPTGTQVAIMDETGNFTAPGNIGEIVLKGANVTRGYEGDREANQKGFTRGWFRTGDLGYRDGDGYLFLTGRLKEVINRGGEKISPFEIDRMLTEHSQIVEAVSFAVKHPSLGEDLVAAVVVRNKDSATEGTIREYLLDKLAPCKVPSRILIVDKIPKSATGKEQRNGLAEIFAEELTTEFVAPREGIEAAIAKIYAEVLGIDQVGTNENFFALGGDSLRASQVIARIRAIFEINFTVATIFMKSTVAELAAEVLAITGKTNDEQTECHVGDDEHQERKRHPADIV